jgi:catechol 2,3-dioxygenase-like lactoylglutathione lyase family enzyme
LLHHVSLEVPASEADASVEFWGLVGFEAVAVPAELGDYVRWVERAGTQIHLILTDAEHATVPALGHVAVVVDEFDETTRRVAAAGYEVEEHRQLWGARRAFATGPAGHRVELMASPPPASA